MAALPLLPVPSFLKEGLLLPVRNPGLFGPILALIVAEKVLHASLLVLHPLHEAQDVISIVGAVRLLTAVTVDPVIGAITTFAAVTAYGIGNEGEALAFLQVLRRLFNAGGLTVGPVATAVHGQIMAVAYQLGVGALLFLLDILVRYTRTLLLHDLVVLVALVAGIAQRYLGLVLSVAVVVSSSEPECHRSAVLSRAWVTTAKNAPQAVILLIANSVRVDIGSGPRTTASREPLDLVYLLVSSLARVFSVCAVTAYYNECWHRVQGRAEELLLIETGEEWLNSLPLQCRRKLQEILQGRFSMRHMVATLWARVKCLCIWMLAFVSTHPWVAAGIAVVCASRISAEGPPSIFYQNELLPYRNFLRQEYHVYPKGCCLVGGSKRRYKCP